jgi:N-formylglutamate amidohydrolase
MSLTPDLVSNPLFEVQAPAQWHVPAVFNSPHSGCQIPQAFLGQTRLTAAELRQSEDYLVDELFGACVDCGAPMLRSLATRAWLDLNREPYELDARMFNESLPGFMNTSSTRVAAGFGTIPRFVGDGMEIYRKRLSLVEAYTRVETFYKPYHRLLTGLLNECHQACGFVLLIDCHSMPQAEGAAKAGQPDVVIGDRFGAACGSAITVAVEEFFAGKGLHIARNRPYAGGFITEAHGAPHLDRHALQIEVNRGLYMDERKQCRSAGFASLKKVLDEFAATLSKLLTATPLPWQRAAE